MRRTIAATDVFVTSGTPGNTPSVVGTEPVLATNDAATSYVSYPAPVGADPGIAYWDVAPLSVPPIRQVILRVAADFDAGFDLAWGAAILDASSLPTTDGGFPGTFFSLAELNQIGSPFDGFTARGWAEVDYVMTPQVGMDQIRYYLSGTDPTLPNVTLNIRHQVGATSGDGTYEFDVTYVALILVVGDPRGRQFPRDDVGRTYPHPRSVQSQGRVGWSGHYYARGPFERQERRCR